MIENPQEENQTIVRPGQLELGIEVHLVDGDTRFQRLFQQPRPPQGIEIGGPIVEDIHLVAQSLEEKGERAIGAADVGDGLPPASSSSCRRGPVSRRSRWTRFARV